MKTRFFLLALAASLLAFSCTKENKEGKGPEKDGFVTVTISAASEGTKTSLGEPVEGKRQISWVEGDEIKIVWGGGSSDFAIAQAESDGASTTFTVSVPEGVTTLYAVYPAGAFESFSDGSLSVNVPAVQNGQFASANIAVARSTVEQASFAFKNVCSYILTDITGAGVGRVTVSAEGQVLCGKVPVSFSEAGEAVLGTFSETASSVMASGLSVGPCAIAVLPGLDFTSGVNVKFSDAEGTEISQVDLKKEHTLARGEVLSTGALDDATIISYFASPEGSGTKDGSSSENAWGTAELIAWLKTSNPAVPEIKTPDAPFNIYLADGTYNIQEAVTIEEKGRSFNFISTGKNAVITSPETQTATILYYNKADNISFHDITFSGHKGNGTGKVALSFGYPASGTPEVLLSGCTFENNTNTGVNASLVLSNRGRNTLYSCTFKNNSAGGAPAINIDQAATEVEMNNCVFQDNHIVKYSSAQDAGAIKIGNGSVTATGCLFKDNMVDAEANGGGAALWIASSSDKPILFKDNCQFIGNKTNNDLGKGGAIYITGGSNIIFQNCTLSGNGTTAETSTSYGGAVCIGNFNKQAASNISVEFKSCTFDANTVANSSNTGFARGAGAIFMDQPDKTTVSCTLDNCILQNHVLNHRSGGAIYANAGTLNIIGGKISNNDIRSTYESTTGTNYGGAIEIVDAACSISGDTEISDNLASNGAGAIYLPYGYTGTLSVDGASFLRNKTEGSGGGAIRINQASGSKFEIKNTTFKGNTAPTVGGAIANYRDVDLDIINCTFEENSSSSLGGAIYLGGENGADNTVLLSGCEFIKNDSYNGGGAIAISNDQNKSNSEAEGGYNTCKVNVTINNNTVFDGNSCAGSGGAIDARTSGKLDIQNTEFNNNYTTGDSNNGSGGAIALRYGMTYYIEPLLRAETLISNCIFNGNYTKNGNANSKARGGAIGVINCTGGVFNDIRIDKCYFKGNSATQGGALFGQVTYDNTKTGTTLYVNDCTFEGNYGGFRNGVGFTFFYFSELCFNNCSFRNTWGGASQAYTNLNWMNVTTCNFVMSNCSMIGQPQRSDGDTSTQTDGNLLRLETDKAGASYSLINSIIGGPDWCKSIIRASAQSATFNFYSNKLSPHTLTANGTDAFNGTDWLGTAGYFGGLAWAANSTAGQEYKSGWNWNGTLATGTPATMNTRGDVKAKIQAANAGFYTWLQSVDGLDKDQRGNARGSADTDAIWPGAFQN
ncbi:MAG: hypothetical protein IJ686_03180 [Bacteroidales bacterium]|nr:hypothetical protein [Bacteroidales bacterium]